MTVARNAVSSSLIASIGYSADATLEVEFCYGAVYGYFAVPQTVHQAFLDAESKGTFFNRFVKPCFPCRRLSDVKPPSTASS